MPKVLVEIIVLLKFSDVHSKVMGPIETAGVYVHNQSDGNIDYGYGST